MSQASPSDYGPRYSPGNLDDKLLDFFHKKPRSGGFYIEAGAVNGVWQSNTLLLETKLGWTGLLVEPDYNLYLECLKSRSNNFIHHAALVDSDYKLPYVQGTFADSMEAFHRGRNLNPYNKKDPESLPYYELALQGQIIYKNPSFNIKPGSQLITVPAKTLSFILQYFDIKREIDLLSLDVEGSEIQALDGLDLKINRPKYIIIETTTWKNKRDTIFMYLSNFNYTFLEQMTPNDALYVDGGI